MADQGTFGTAAPGRLETVRRFVNSLDIEESDDRLTTPEQLQAWLRDAGLAGDVRTARPADVRRATALREALRAALAANHAHAPVPGDAAAVIDSTARRAGLRLRFQAEGWVPEAGADGVDGALGALLAIVATAMQDGTWSRLKVCENDTCRWAFYDSSRSRTGRWCSMLVCGNRVKQQAWRTRHGQGQGEAT